MNNPAQPTPDMAQLLAQLHGIVSPDPVSDWPIAIGWWILAITLVTLFVSVVYFSLQSYNNNAYRRKALIIIEQMTAEPSPAFATAVSALLKRVALAAFPSQRQSIVGAYGQQWPAWLNEKVAAPLFNENCSRALAEAPYKQNIEFDAQQLRMTTRAWIKAHKRSAKAEARKDV